MVDLAEARKALKEAQAVLDEATVNYQAAMKVESDASLAELRSRQMVEFDKTMALRDSAFYLMGNDRRDPYRPYILPYGAEAQRFNPILDDDNGFGADWKAYSTAIICKKDERTRPTRLIWTSGMPNETDKIGQRFEARHDQTNAKLGEYEIVGLAIYGPDGNLARTVGNVPSIKFAQSCYK